MDIAKYSLRFPTNVWLMVLIFMLGGVIALSKIGRLEDPPFTIKQVKVITQYPGASAHQVEQEVTELLETTIQQMSQLRRVTSVSAPGRSDITVEVERNFDGSELPQIWDELRKRLHDVQGNLPPGTQAPVVYDDFGEVFGLYYALTAPEFSATELRHFAKQIRRELLMVDGVAKVQVSGIRQEQITAYIDPYRLASLGVSFPQIAQLFSENIRPFNGGRVEIDGKQLRVLVDEPSSQVDALENISMVVPGTNRTIKVSDVATLKVEPADIQPAYMRHQGNEAVTLAVSAQSGVNIVDVGHNVREKIEQVITQLPAGISLDAIYDQASIVDESVDGFIQNLVMSVAVVVLTLWVFMGWRSAVVVGTTLLVTVMGTVLIMWLMELRLQRISLGALVIAMGMLVDNAIVIAEGMMMQVKRGERPQPAASFIVKRTQWPLLGATIIGIAAFSGIGLSDDATGEFLYSLFAVVMISLLLSWVLAITLVPILGKWLYRADDGATGEEIVSPFQHKFIGVLRGILKVRWVALAGLLIVTVIAYGSFGMVKQGFFPPSNAPLFYIHYWGPQDTDIRATEQAVRELEQTVLGKDGVIAVSSFIGRGADRFTLTYAPQQANESYALMLVRVTDKALIDDLIAALRTELPQQDQNAEFYLQRLQFGPGVGAKIGIRFSGPDGEVLRQLAAQAMDTLRADGKLQDIRHDWREPGLTLNTEFDEVAAGTAGVSRADFRDTIEYATNGLKLGQLYDGDYAYPIRAKMAARAELSQLDAIANSQVWSSQQGRYVPFRQISAGLTLGSEEVQIQRRNRVPTITVWAEPGVGETASKARLRILPAIESIPLPVGYKLEWGGEFESSGDAQKALGQGLPAGFLVMFIVSVLLFGRARQPLIIWAVVPMAVVGVVAGLLATDMAFGFMSLLGFLSLFGMLIKNAIVLLEEIDLQVEEGKPIHDAILDATASRLRPVALAAVTTILGMAPLLTDAFFADMSVTIMGGLTFATILTLVAVPVLYSLLFKVSYRK